MPHSRRSWPATFRRLLVRCRHTWRLAVKSGAQLVAENLVLRKRLALHQERRVQPRRTDSATRVMLVLLSQLWRGTQRDRRQMHFPANVDGSRGCRVRPCFALGVFAEQRGWPHAM